MVIERRLNKGVERGRREGKEEGRMRAGEGGGEKEESRQICSFFFFVGFNVYRL